jgi:hypothetical protein
MKCVVFALMIVLTIADVAMVLWPGPQLLTAPRMPQPLPQMQGEIKQPQRAGGGAGSNAPAPISTPR